MYQGKAKSHESIQSLLNVLKKDYVFLIKEQFALHMIFVEFAKARNIIKRIYTESMFVMS